MNVLVGYATIHGSTLEIAERMGPRLAKAGLSADVRPMDSVREPENYAAFVLGSAVPDQAWLNAGRDFVQRRLTLLPDRPVWLFRIGMDARGPARRWRRMGHKEEPEVLAGLPGPLPYRGHRLLSCVVRPEHIPLGGRIALRLRGCRYGDYRDWDAIDTRADTIAGDLAPTLRKESTTMATVPEQPADEAPVQVESVLDSPLSRWLWLVKWILVLPHYVVLLFLWLAFFVVSVVAFFSILFTGRYPRALFDFNLGVLRWGWRVAYYGYGALGTDRYPPFSLGEEPDYPARLDIAYPKRLSRGLVLVKWILVIPHLMLLGLFLGGLHNGWWGGGLIGVLVLFAGVALLFTNGYPKGMFDLVLGLNRWVLRVTAYAALMTDVYPPFRLDMGGSERETLP